MTQLINQTNVNSESFYNLCQLSNATKYWNPLEAFKAHNVEVEVEKDECGNIVKVVSATGNFKINLN